MSLLVGVGASLKTNTSQAISEAYSQAVASLESHTPHFLLLLASSSTYNQQLLLNSLKSLSPTSLILGCSTSGEITSVLGPQDNSLALMAIYSDEVKFTPGIGTNIKKNEHSSGVEFANSIKNSGIDPQAALIFPDGLSGNGADIVRGILSVFGDHFMLAGGSAGDDFLFKQTFQYYKDQVITDSVVGVGLSGKFSFGIGVRHGWIPIGTSRVVTKSEGNIVYEFNNRPAIEIYEDQFGKDKTLIDNKEPFAKLAITYPLGIDLPGEGEFLIRDPLEVSDTGAITCAAEVPIGSEVYIMIGSREEAITAAAVAAKNALTMLKDKKPKAAFLFNCIARKKLLLDKKKEEIDTIQNIIGKDVPLIGFYTYGEQAPLGSEILTCSFHNETDVLFVLA